MDRKSSPRELSSGKLSKMCTCVPSRSGVTGMPAGPPSALADSSSALPSPAPSACSVSAPSCLIQPMPAPVCQPAPQTAVLFPVLRREMEKVYLVSVLCVNSTMNLRQDRTIEPIGLAGYLG